MTKYSFETASKLFDKHGYSKTCDFVRISDTKKGKFLARCKTCGYEFERDANILRKPQKKLRCPECYKRNVSAMLEWYAAGHSTAECAEKFSMTKAQVTNYAMRHGVSGGIDKAEAVRRMQANSGTAKGNATQMKRAASRIRDGVALRGFELLDEWRGANRQYRVRCTRCGHEFELKGGTLRACKFKCPECPDPLESLRESLREWGEAAKAMCCMTKKATATLDKLDAWVTGEYSWNKDTMAAHEPRVATCGHCGARWVHWPTTTQSGYTKRVPHKYCSKRCRARANRAKENSNVGHRLRKYGSQGKPRDAITLDGLIERDNGTCYLCSKPVDKEDRWRDENGYHICGGNYPSIDHVVPLCKGGTHTWDNVRLAHRDCNSLKESRTLEELFSS